MSTSILCYILFPPYLWMEYLNKIEVLQKKCLRIMTFSAFNSHTNQLFIDLKLVKVCDIIKSQQLKIVYDFYNNVLRTDIQHLFTFSRDIPIIFN